LGINWGLSNAALITVVNQVIAPRKIAAAIGTIGTIWNIVGSILLAISSSIFHTVDVTSSFLPAFHAAVDFNILFAFLILGGAVWVWTKLRSEV
jgi:hypothetical protein